MSNETQKTPKKPIVFKKEETTIPTARTNSVIKDAVDSNSLFLVKGVNTEYFKGDVKLDKKPEGKPDELKAAGIVVRTSDKEESARISADCKITCNKVIQRLIEDLLYNSTTITGHAAAKASHMITSSSLLLSETNKGTISHKVLGSLPSAERFLSFTLLNSIDATSNSACNDVNSVEYMNQFKSDLRSRVNVLENEIIKYLPEKVKVTKKTAEEKAKEEPKEKKPHQKESGARTFSGYINHTVKKVSMLSGIPDGTIRCASDAKDLLCGLIFEFITIKVLPICSQLLSLEGKKTLSDDMMITAITTYFNYCGISIQEAHNYIQESCDMYKKLAAEEGETNGELESGNSNSPVVSTPAPVVSTPAPETKAPETVKKTGGRRKSGGGNSGSETSTTSSTNGVKVVETVVVNDPTPAAVSETKVATGEKPAPRSRAKKNAANPEVKAETNTPAADTPVTPLTPEAGTKPKQTRKKPVEAK